MKYKYNICIQIIVIIRSAFIHIVTVPRHSLNRLTGFTLEMLALGSRAEWESRIYIDPDVLTKMAEWLCDQQNISTGGFKRQSYFFDLKMLVSERVSVYIIHIFIYSLTPSLTHPLTTHSLTHSLTHSSTHSLTHSPI